VVMKRFFGVLILFSALVLPAKSFGCFFGCGGGFGFVAIGGVAVGWGHGGGFFPPRPFFGPPPPFFGPPPFIGPMYGGYSFIGPWGGYGYGAYGPFGGYSVRVRRGLFGGVRARANYWGTYAGGFGRPFHPYI
jgi:hypothetical protein